MAGRKTKLTKQLQAALCRGIRLGLTQKSAAEYAGIGETTFCVWMADERPAFREFQRAVRLANEQAKAQLLRPIQQAAHEHKVVTTRSTVGGKDGPKTETTETTEWDWRAAAWILERRFPDEYGQQVALNVKGMSDQQLLAFIQKELGAVGAGPGGSETPGAGAAGEPGPDGVAGGLPQP